MTHGEKQLLWIGGGVLVFWFLFLRGPSLAPAPASSASSGGGLLNSINNIFTGISKLAGTIGGTGKAPPGPGDA